jgi:hypothetical protein
MAAACSMAGGRAGSLLIGRRAVAGHTRGG